MDQNEYNLQLKIAILCGEKNSCGTKINYKSEATSVKKALEINMKKGRNLEAYPCPFCNGWHLGSKKTKEDIDKITEGKDRFFKLLEQK